MSKRKDRSHFRCTRCKQIISAADEDRMMFASARPVGDDLLPKAETPDEMARRGYFMETVCPTCWAEHPEPARFEHR